MLQIVQRDVTCIATRQCCQFKIKQKAKIKRTMETYISFSKCMKMLIYSSYALNNPSLKDDVLLIFWLITF